MDTALTNDNKNKFVGKIDSVQLLRAIASLFIFFCHIDYIYNVKLFDFGRGVHLFFVISGFVIMYSTQKETNKHFIGKRLLRLLPLYWLLTILSFGALKILPGIIRSDSSLKALICSLLFIPFERTSQRHDTAVFPIIGPGWTLYFEIVFSFIFGVSMEISHKYRGIITSAVCFILVLAGYILAFNNVILEFYTRAFWLDFILGIISYYVLKKMYDMNFSVVQKRVAFLLSLCILLLVYVFPLQDVVSREILQPFLCAVTFILFCISLKEVSAPKFLVHIGDISYSFYLLHYYIIIVLGKIFDLSVFSAKSVMITLLALGLSIFAAHISYTIVEVGFTNFVKKKLKW